MPNISMNKDAHKLALDQLKQQKTTLKNLKQKLLSEILE
jgi:hypothetical protein